MIRRRAHDGRRRPWPLAGFALFALVAVSCVEITKTDSADPVTVGQTFTYTIDVDIVTGGSSGTVTMTDNVPPGLTILDVDEGAFDSCTTSGQEVECSGFFSSDTTATVTITVRVEPEACGGGSGPVTLVNEASAQGVDSAQTVETTTVNCGPAAGCSGGGSASTAATRSIGSASGTIVHSGDNESSVEQVARVETGDAIAGAQILGLVVTGGT